MHNISDIQQSVTIIYNNQYILISRCTFCPPCTHQHLRGRKQLLSSACTCITVAYMLYNNNRLEAIVRTRHAAAAMNDAMLNTILGLLLQCSYTVAAKCPSPLPINTLVGGVAKDGVIPYNRAGQLYSNGI